MQYNYLLGILLVLTVFLMIFQLVLVFFYIRDTAKKREEEKPFTDLIESTKQKSNVILHDAISEANQMLVAAEMEGIKELSKQKHASSIYAEELRKHLQIVEDTIKRLSDDNARRASASYDAFIKQMEAALVAHVKKNNDMLEDRAAEMVKKSEEMLSGFLEEIHKKVHEQVDAEMDATRKEINEYKARRIKVLDERIIDMLEDVLQVALERKLTLSEQSELVYRALEEAKRENAFAR